jgi:hypothetical protein
MLSGFSQAKGVKHENENRCGYYGARAGSHTSRRQQIGVELQTPTPFKLVGVEGWRRQSIYLIPYFRIGICVHSHFWQQDLPRGRKQQSIA